MSTLTIRQAHHEDISALERLAALDSSALPEGELLLAEMCGRPVAALGVDNGRSIADPFVPTADVVALLELRAQPRERTVREQAARFLPRAA